jgi:hypothetical protein
MTSFWYQDRHHQDPDDHDNEHHHHDDTYNEYDFDDHPTEKEYITSDEEQLDPNSISSVLACLKRNSIDDELVEDLTNLLENNGHYDLACQMARICLEISPNNINMMKTIKRIDRPNNLQLDSKIRNLWMMSQTYLHNDNLLVKEIVDNKYVEPGTGTPSHEVDLEGIVFRIDHIPTFPDTMVVIPSNSDYHVFRKFHVEPFQMYNLQIKFACSNNLDVSLSVNTEIGENRLSYKLSGSQIQYNFNSLNQSLVEIGLKGHNRPGQTGQLRIMELSLTRTAFNYTLIDKNLKNRSLSPTLPIVANLYITTTDSMEGIRVTLDSLIYQVDLVNIYLNNLSREQVMNIDILLHNTKYRIKQGRDGRIGSWQMSTEIVGYQFMIEAGIVYDDNYVALMLSKIQQYSNRVVVGLHGIQLMSDYQDWSKSKKTISNIMVSTQDIRCHLLGVSSMAFLSGIVGNILDMNTLRTHITPPSVDQDLTPTQSSTKIEDQEVPVLFAIMAQRAKVGMICVERTDKMIKYRHRDETKMIDEIGSSSEELIKSCQPWKYY